MPRKSKDDAKQDAVKADHRTFRKKVEVAREDRTWMQETITSPRMQRILSRFRKGIADLTEMLLTIEKKDLDKAQAQIHARKELLELLSNAYEEELREAKKELEEFEKNNALFLHGQAGPEAVTESA